MFHIVTDGAADMPEEWLQLYDIKVIPINIQFGEKTYLQFLDLDFASFYEMVSRTKTIPKTSQPSPHQFVEFYKQVAKPGETILSIHVTSKLSGTYASALAAAKELEGTYNIIPFDSAGGSMGIGFMLRAARLMEQAGKSVEEILQHLKELRSKVQIILTLDKLDYARMSGRVGALSAALASALNVKPVAVLKDGIVEMIGKVRTRKASLDRILELAHEACGSRPIHLGVLHARDPQSGEQLLARARRVLNIRDAFITELSVALAVNFGPGTVGLVLYPASQ